MVRVLVLLVLTCVANENGYFCPRNRPPPTAGFSEQLRAAQECSAPNTIVAARDNGPDSAENPDVARQSSGGFRRNCGSASRCRSGSRSTSSERWGAALQPARGPYAIA